MQPDSESPPVHRIAVIGSGVSGLDGRPLRLPLGAGDALRGRRPARRARRHPRGARGVAHAGDRHRLHRAQPAHLPGAAAPVRRARRGHPAVGDVDVDPRRRHGPRVGRRSRPRRAGADRPHPRPRPLPADAHRDPSLPSPRAGAARRAGRRAHAARVPGRRRLHGVLRAALHGAAGRRGVVLRPRRRAGLPGALPVHVPRAPRDARHLRLARVAHGHRRLPGVRRPAGRGAARRAHRLQGHLGRRDRATACRSPTATAGSRRTTAWWSRPTPTRPSRCSPSRRRPSARCCAALPYSRQRGAAAHRHLGAAHGPASAGVLELPPACRQPRPAWWSPTT